MRKRIGRLVVFASVLALVMAVNVGVALADHPGGTNWTCDTGATEDGEFCDPADATTNGPAAENALEPVGRRVFAPGAPGTPGQAGLRNGIVNNPLCPLHGVAGT